MIILNFGKLDTGNFRFYLFFQLLNLECDSSLSASFWLPLSLSSWPDTNTRAYLTQWNDLIWSRVVTRNHGVIRSPFLGQQAYISEKNRGFTTPLTKSNRTTLFLLFLSNLTSFSLQKSQVPVSGQPTHYSRLSNTFFSPFVFDERNWIQAGWFIQPVSFLP